jgi:carboxyl-terminal processing protease
LDTLAHVYDPHSDYLGHEQLESMSIAMNLSLVGIGATLESVDGYCTIHELLPGGPAARSGLLTPGDRIVAVKRPTDSEPIDVVDMPLSHTVDLIRGHKGSVVTLSIVPKSVGAGQPPKLVTLVRDAIKLEDQEARASIVDVPAAEGKTERVGVIDLPSFYADMGERVGERRSATADVARLLAKLETEHVQGVLLDLRHNPGGSLQEAITLTGLFIRKGPVVQTRDQRGEVEVGADTDSSIAYDGPLVLLTSRLSASASEILTGALQDYGRAVVVGDASTFGKGTVQAVLPLARVMDKAGLAHAYDPGALKITTSKFYRPSGASTQLRGVASDIVLPSTTDLSEVNESTLKDALQWDAVAPTRYAHLDRVEAYLGSLRERSAERVAADAQLAHVREDVVRLKQKLAAKSVSLNEAERRQEIAEAKARDESRAVELAALDATEPVRREITLESLDVAGSRTATTGESSAKHAARGDAILHEGVRILADYAGLMTSPGS